MTEKIKLYNMKNKIKEEKMKIAMLGHKRIPRKRRWS